jgi:hypothetical protein
LDQELSHLPDPYRAVIVLGALEGRTRKQVARQLGVPEGTVAGRLARARALLAKRLTQRGVTLSSGALATVLAQNVVSADVPDSVVSSTIRVASSVAAGQVAATGPVSVKVAALSEGVMKAMLLHKLKTGMTAVLVLGLICAAASLCLHRPAQGEQNPGKSEPADAVKADLAGQFKHRVPFEIGLTETNEGGRIEIQEVWGTRPKIEVGGYYLVRGKYVLPPGQRGALYLFVTADGDWGRVGTTIMDLQHTNLDKDKGQFTLVHGMAGPGYFHLYLATPDRYSRMFANVYFGTGDNVWRKKQ